MNREGLISPASPASSQHSGGDGFWLWNCSSFVWAWSQNDILVDPESVLLISSTLKISWRGMESTCFVCPIRKNCMTSGVHLIVRVCHVLEKRTSSQQLMHNNNPSHLVN
jgi:hypothetical protein